MRSIYTRFRYAKDKRTNECLDKMKHSVRKTEKFDRQLIDEDIIVKHPVKFLIIVLIPLRLFWSVILENICFNKFDTVLILISRMQIIISTSNMKSNFNSLLS
jgi:hypothetical protein